MTYVNQLSLPNSPSEMTSIPSSACRRTTAATAVRKVAVVVCSSVSGPSARTSGGRIILPACVVRMRSVLRFKCVDRIRYRIDLGGKGTSGMQASNGRHVTRRAFLTLFGVGTSAVVLSACGAAATPAVAPTAPAATAPTPAVTPVAAAGQPKAGGKLTAT